MWGIPLSALALFRRQEFYAREEVPFFPLQVIEEIDDGQ